MNYVAQSHHLINKTSVSGLWQLLKIVVWRNPANLQNIAGVLHDSFLPMIHDSETGKVLLLGCAFPAIFCDCFSIWKSEWILVLSLF